MITGRYPILGAQVSISALSDTRCILYITCTSLLVLWSMDVETSSLSLNDCLSRPCSKADPLNLGSFPEIEALVIYIHVMNRCADERLGHHLTEKTMVHSSDYTAILFLMDFSTPFVAFVSLSRLPAGRRLLIGQP